MVKTLDVYFNEKVIGQLTQDKHGDVSFAYSHLWLNDPQAIAISCSLPLQAESFKKKQCHAFFEGILPEDYQRKKIAKILSISDNNDFSMLEKIGGECAGALTFISSQEKLHTEKYAYQELTHEELATILRELPNKPLLAGKQGVRLSLAGVQDKLAIYVQDNKTFIPLNNAPSSHILKPAHGQYDDIIFNEFFCLKLAKKVGLSVANAEIKKIEDINYLLVERYDRVEVDQKLIRLHQEDFCQALGVSSKKKYQNEEGPSLKQIFNLIRSNATVPVVELEKLLETIIFNFFIGNCDAHGKNFSLLYQDKILIAPLYDLICTLYYKDLDTRMAMKVGGEYKIEKISMKNFVKLSEEIGFSKVEVKKRVLQFRDKIIASLPSIEINYPAQEAIVEIIKQRCLTFG